MYHHVKCRNVRGTIFIGREQLIGAPVNCRKFYGALKYKVSEKTVNNRENNKYTLFYASKRTVKTFLII